MVGFEELGNTDTFRKDLLEDRLGASGEFLRSLFEERVRADHGLDPPCSGVITPRSKSNLQKPIFGFTQPATENQDASDDWE